MTINYSRLPDYMQDGVKRYIEHGIMPSDFLQAVFSNELVEAYNRADSVNIAAMFEYAKFLYNEAPRGSWGSRKAMTEWCEHNGMERYQCLK